MAGEYERSFAFGNDYVNQLYDTQARKKAGSAVAAGDYQGASQALGARGDWEGAHKLGTYEETQKNAGMDRQIKMVQAQGEYLKRAVPIFSHIFKTAGPQATLQAFDQIAPELQQLGVSPQTIAQYKQAFQANPEQFLQAMAASAAKDPVWRTQGDDIVGIDPSTGKEISRIKGGPSAASSADALREANSPFNAQGQPNAAVQAYEARKAATARSERPGSAPRRNLTPAEIKERGFKPGTRAQINETTGQVNILQSPNDMDLKNAGYANRVIQATKRIDALASQGITKPSARILISELNGITRIVASDQKDRQFIQASKEWLAPILRKDTGAAVTDTEFVYYMDIYIPRPEDGPEVLAQKKAAREAAVQSLMAESAGAYGDMFGAQPQQQPPPAGGRIPYANAPPSAQGGNVIRYDAQGNRVQ